MKISFEQIWDKIIIPLEGKIIYTLDENSPNRIIKVSHDALTRNSQNDTKPQRIPRAVFEEIYNYIMENGEISRLKINQALPHRLFYSMRSISNNTTVEYQLNPIRLYKK